MMKHLAAFMGGVAAAAAVVWALDRRGVRTWEDVRELGDEAMDRGREVAEDMGRQVSEKVREMAPQVREKVREIAPAVSDAIDKIRMIDLNSSSAEDLAAIPGISEEMSERIVENRPYRNKLDLVARMIVPGDVYESIKDHVNIAGANDAVKVA